MHGNESSKAEEEANEDYVLAAAMTTAMIEAFEGLGMNPFAAINGAFSELVSNLIDLSPDARTALAVLSTSISTAASNTNPSKVPNPEEVH